MRGTVEGGISMFVISACLVGVECRYNGQGAVNEKAVELLRSGQAIPLCPEVLGGLLIPRPCCEIQGKKVVSAQGEDLTEAYQKGARIAAEIAKLSGCKKAIVKSKSPSCGCGTIYDGTFSGRLMEGDGVFCKMLKEIGIEVCTEEFF